MGATLRRVVGTATPDRVKPNRVAMTVLSTGLSEGFEIAFAICVMLGALWLLASGYV